MHAPVHTRLTHPGAQGVTWVGDAFGRVDDPPVLQPGGAHASHSWGRGPATLAHTGFRAVTADLRGRPAAVLGASCV